MKGIISKRTIGMCLLKPDLKNYLDNSKEDINHS